jgi:hypothetical protein
MDEDAQRHQSQQSRHQAVFGQALGGFVNAN